jgi:hypothetical protein
MIKAKIEKLGSAWQYAKVKGRVKTQELDTLVVGFDTEYTSKQNKLICFQLHTEENKRVLVEVHPEEILTPLWIYEEVCKLVEREPSHITLITYFSAAELQFLPMLEEGFNIMEYQRGFADCDFELETGAILTVHDMSRWFDGKSLAAAAASFGLKKMDYDVKHVTRACFKSAEFREYAMHDAKLCYEIMQALRKEFIVNTGVEPLIVKTPASAAANAFRRKFVKTDIYCDNNKARYVAMRGTWGGRAEACKRGRFLENYTEYDLKAAYPNSIITLGQVPVQGSWLPVNKVSQIAKHIGGFGKVIFSFPEKVRYPCLPVFHLDSMIFPKEGVSYATFDEISLALEYGATIEVLEMFGYKKGSFILRDYCLWTLEKRAIAKGAAKVMYKLLANSLLGKCAQRLAKIPLEEYMRIAEENNILLDELFSLDKEFLIAFGAVERVNVGPVFMPEWFGLATGRTRMETAIMLNTSDPLYCHTDSVWCKGKPETRFLKAEIKIAGPATVIRTRFAGIGDFKSIQRVKAEKGHIAYHSIWNQVAGLQMLNKFNGETFIRHYPVRRPLRLHEAVRLKKQPGQWVEEYRTGSTAWCFKRCLDGTETRPWLNIEEYETALKASKLA